MAANYFFPILSAKELRLPFYVVTIGIQPLQETVARPQGIEHHQLLLTRRGTGFVELAGRKIPVPAGTVLYHPPHTPHLYYSAGQDWETHWITFAGDGVELILNFDGGVYAGEMNSLFTIHHDLYTSPRDMAWGERASVLLYQLLLNFKNTVDTDSTSLLTMRLKPSVDFMRRHFSETIELKDLAGITGVSPAHYCHLFKSAYQISPFTLLLHLRLQTAKNMLVSQPNQDIEKIALHVGFNSPSYFIKTFKKYEGMTPAVFRKMHIGVH